MPEAVRAVLRRAGIGGGSRVCVALSGGLDSVVLLDLLDSLRSTQAFELSAAHVHHGLSPLADDWAESCRLLCAARGIPFSVHHVSLPVDTPHGIEAAARDARHVALKALPVDWLALAHHRDDQAETVLFRLLRGTGVRGAAAMRHIEPGRHGAPGMLRPLLALPRASLLSHARAAGLAWVEDPSNHQLHFTRNRLRHEILPQLEQVFPAASDMLARAATNFDEAQSLLDDVAAEDALACAAHAPGVLSLARFSALSASRQRNLLRTLLHEAGFEAPARARLIEALRQLGEAHSSSLRLPLGDAACAVYRDRLWLEPEPIVEPVPIACAGLNTVAWGSGRIHFRPALGEGLDARRLERARLGVGRRDAGLRLQPDARRPRRSLKNLCQELGIPPWWRERLPVLYADGVPVWVGAIGADAAWRCPAGEPGMVPEWEQCGAPRIRA